MKSKALRWLLFMLLLTAIVLAFFYRDQLDTVALQQWIEQAGSAAPLLFMLIYAIGTVLFLPGSVMTLAGGALFGPILGTFYNLTGATLGAVLAFVIARYLASDWVEEKTGGRLKRLKEGVENEGWRFVAFVRLVPLFPFNLLNYALGLTRIRFTHYLIATYVCMLPGAIAYTYLGYAGREAVAGGEGLVQKGLLALALLAAVAFLPRIISHLRLGPTLSIDELHQRLISDSALVVLDVRSPGDYEGELGHIQESRNIPLEELGARLPELAPHLEKPIALICTTDRRSKKAAQLLTKQGFADVHVILGGMKQWNAQSLPVQTTANTG
ncbi:MAG: VTT domain-containing protein [gamma proteobacterium symbiont of Bathyaustriella thionipta]|nr:VTT domain-containing protein [gamma proteobacterium symbiont of Bathyaustriella thionipta]